MTNADLTMETEFLPDVLGVDDASSFREQRVTLVCESKRKIDGLWEAVMDDEFHRSFAFRFDSEPPFVPGKSYTIAFTEVA